MSCRQVYRPILFQCLPVADSLAQSYLPGEDSHIALSLSPNPLQCLPVAESLALSYLLGEDSHIALKVPKCEIFHLFDFNDFYGIKSL